MKPDIVLIHGWDPTYYNSQIKDLSNEGIAWSHRSKLISLLSEHYNLHYYNLPGFAGTQEPASTSCDVEDFAFIFHKWLKNQPFTPKFIIGYSFGGAVALMHKVQFENSIPIILISPAIYRDKTLRSEIGAGAKNIIPSWLQDILRQIYQYIASPYYRKGTRFLRNSYNRIVRRDLRYLFDKVNAQEIFLFYGRNDVDTPWKLVESTVIQNRIKYKIIEGGTHQIGQTHADEIMRIFDIDR